MDEVYLAIMKSVVIKIPMSLFGYKYSRKIQRKFPLSLNELSRKQLYYFCKAVKKSANIYEAKLRVLAWVCNLPVALIKSLDIAQTAQLTLMLNGLFDSNDLTTNKLPSIKFSYRLMSHTWLGPADKLANLSVKEFAVADTYFLEYMNSHNTRMLDYLVATLYRSQDKKKSARAIDYNGDLRQPFNEHLLEHRAKMVRALPERTKEMILYFFIGCRNAITSEYEHLFGGGQSQARQSGDWMDIIRTLPSDKFGTIGQAENENVHTVFSVVDRIMMDNKKHKPK